MNQHQLNYWHGENNNVNEQNIMSNPLLLKYANYHIKNNRTIVINAVRRNGKSIKFATARLQRDPEIVIEAIKNGYSEALGYLPNGLEDYPDIVLEAIQYESTLYRNLPDDYKSDRDVILRVINNNCNVFPLLNKNFLNDREIVFIAVSNNGNLLRYASKNLRNDHEIVLTAVRNNGEALEYALDKAKDNREIVLEAIYNNNNAFVYASDRLKNDPEIFIFMFRNNGGYRFHPYNNIFLNEISDEIINNHIAVKKQSNAVIYNIDYDLISKKIKVWMMSGIEKELKNIEPYTTINELGNLIFNQIYVPYINANHPFHTSNEFYLVYRKNYISPLNGNLGIQNYIRQNS